MEDKMINTLEIITKINNHFHQNENIEIINREDLDDKKENLEDYSTLLNNMTHNLEKLSNFDTYSNDEIEGLLHNLHQNFSGYIWHIDEIHELLKALIANFPEKN